MADQQQAAQQAPQQPPANQQIPGQTVAQGPPQGWGQYPPQGPPPQGPPSGDPNQQQQPPQGQWNQWGQPQPNQWSPPQGQYGQYPQQGPPPQGTPSQGPPAQGAPPQGPPPQGAPPQGAPQGQWGYPPQQQWGPPQGYQQQWGPPQGYQQQQWGPPQGYPPQGQPGQPPQQIYQQQPPQAYGSPAPQGFQQAPQGYQPPPPVGFQPTTQQQPLGTPIPQPGYVQPTTQQQQPLGAPVPQPGYVQPTGVPTPPSPGFIPHQKAVSYDADYDVKVIIKACKGFNTDEKTLIATLVKLDPLQIESLNQKYTADTKKPLYSLIEDKTRGNLEDGLSALAKGPLFFYVWLIWRSTEGLGTKEEFLDLALLGRSNADIKAIKAAFQAKYHVSLESIIKKDLSGGEERLFDMVMSASRAEDSSGVNPQTVTAEVKALHNATEARMIADGIEVSRIFVKNNDATIAAIATEYEKTYHIPVETLIKGKFSGHHQDSLLFILRGVQDKAKRDAELIEKTMAGLGTRDEELTFRLIAAHWIPGAIPAVKAAYQRMFGNDLISRVRGETSGDHERLLVAILSK